MGALSYYLFCSVPTSTTKRKPMQTVEMKIKMDCDGCERRVRNAVTSIKGVKKVEIDRKLSRVTVNGQVDSNKVLKRVMEKTGKKAEFWPYIEQQLVYFPYTSQTYDKKAPVGFVKNVHSTFLEDEEKLTSVFSDDNVNACSIM